MTAPWGRKRSFLKISMELPDHFPGPNRKDKESVLGMVILALERLWEVRHRIEVIQIKFDGDTPYNATFRAVLVSANLKERMDLSCRYNSRNSFTYWSNLERKWSFAEEDVDLGAAMLVSKIAERLDQMAHHLENNSKSMRLDADFAKKATKTVKQ